MTLYHYSFQSCSCREEPKGWGNISLQDKRPICLLLVVNPQGLQARRSFPVTGTTACSGIPRAFTPPCVHERSKPSMNMLTLAAALAANHEVFHLWYRNRVFWQHPWIWGILTCEFVHGVTSQVLHRSWQNPPKCPTSSPWLSCITQEMKYYIR